MALAHLHPSTVSTIGCDWYMISSRVPSVQHVVDPLHHDQIEVVGANSPTTIMPLSSIELDTAYSLKSSQSINVSSGARISQATFQPLKPCNEDRTVFVECSGLGFIVGVFDGHYAHELSDYASRTLPKLLLDRIADATATPGTNFSDAVTASFIEVIKDFDASLLQNLLSHFPELDKPEWWLNPRWDDHAEIYGCIGYSNEDSRFHKARRAVVGSTLLIGFMGEGRKHV